MRFVLVVSLSLMTVTAWAPTTSADTCGTMIIPTFGDPVPIGDSATIPVTAGYAFSLTGVNAVGQEADFDIYFDSGYGLSGKGNEFGTVPDEATTAEITLYSATTAVQLVPGPATWCYHEEPVS